MQARPVQVYCEIEVGIFDKTKKTESVIKHYRLRGAMA